MDSFLTAGKADSSDSVSPPPISDTPDLWDPLIPTPPVFFPGTLDPRIGFQEKQILQSLRNQKTLAKTTVVQGFGFWTGEDVRVEFSPAPENSGLVFVRTDLKGHPRIPVHVGLREDKPRQTSLSLNGGEIRVDMVEHLLAALSAMQIDNCEIRIDRPEVPGMDGSAAPFFSALKEAGTLEQNSKKPLRVLLEPFRVGDENSYIDAKPCSRIATVFKYHLDYRDHFSIGTQDFSFTFSPGAFERELVRCRTFLLKSEADHLLSLGLCRRVSPREVLVFDENGPIENHLLFENECARHKVLDMVGDFSLLAFDWIGEFYGHFSGHHLNAECVKKLMEHSVLIDANQF